MSNKIFLVLLAMAFLLSGCDLFDLTTKDCDHKNETTCSADTINYCVWNVDRCQRGFDEFAPKVPSTLAKAKMVAVGRGICGIDMNDELTCVPDSMFGTQILPHSSLKYKHVAISSSLVKDKICATKMDGTSVCFSEKGKVLAGPTQSPVLQTLPASFKNTVCGFSAQDIFCESDEKPFEKLGQLLPGVVNLAKNNPADPAPELVQFSFNSKEFSLTPKIIIALFNSGKLLFAQRDDTAPQGWRLVHGGILPNIKSVSTFEETICTIGNGAPGVACAGGNNHTAAHIPADISAATLSAVATSENHACVIVDGSGELKCFGALNLTRNIPTNVRGVKQVAASNNLTCYITNDNDLRCFGKED